MLFENDGWTLWGWGRRTQTRWGHPSTNEIWLLPRWLLLSYLLTSPASSYKSQQRTDSEVRGGLFILSCFFDRVSGQSYNYGYSSPEDYVLWYVCVPWRGIHSNRARCSRISQRIIIPIRSHCGLFYRLWPPCKPSEIIRSDHDRDVSNWLQSH